MVEWKKLGEIAKVQKTKNKKHVTENAYSITQAGLIPTKNFFKEKTHVTSSDTSGYYIVERDWFVYSPSRIDVGSISYLKDEGPVIVSPIDVVFSIDKTICLPSYLLNYFFTYEGKKALLKNREGVEGMGRRNLPFDAIKTMPIPVPSLSEQSRIVSILDTFTSSISNLKQQIEERRKQYEYERDLLLDLEGKEGVERIPLKEVCDVINGRAYSQPELLDKGKYRVLRVGNFFSNDNWYYSDLELEDKYYCKNGDLLYAWSASFGPHIWKEERVIYHYHIWKMECKDRLHIKYMYYWLQSKDMYKQAFSNLHGATMAHLTKALMESLKVSLPPLSTQSRIVSILDTFEQSIANLEAQLAMREKQYESYRNQLLTFE